jgi:hypothetical protein
MSNQQSLVRTRHLARVVHSELEMFLAVYKQLAYWESYKLRANKNSPPRRGQNFLLYISLK